MIRIYFVDYILIIIIHSKFLKSILIFRYNNTKENVQEHAPKSAITTYFQKTLVEPNSHLDSRKNDNQDMPESSKRKPTIGQLPIKPKPLTIRKTPGLEPPKLKVQPVISTNFSRKTSDSNLASHLKTSYLPQSEETLSKPSKSLESSGIEERIPVQEVAPLKNETDALSEKLNSKLVFEDQLPVVTKENGSACDEPDFIKSETIMEKAGKFLLFLLLD